jgi:hypothetical protein
VLKSVKEVKEVKEVTPLSPALSPVKGERERFVGSALGPML